MCTWKIAFDIYAVNAGQMSVDFGQERVLLVPPIMRLIIITGAGSGQRKSALVREMEVAGSEVNLVMIDVITFWVVIATTY